MEKQKRVLAIHDISCIGKCSLTVALPIISATGIEVSVLPTALLSAHTGIEGYTYKELTSDMMPIVNHFKQTGVSFDAIYTGFLGSYSQLNIILQIFNMFKTDNSLIMVDPVMADNGKLYNVYDKRFASGMKELIKMADIIVPNITEAAMLTGEKYKKGPYTLAYIENMVNKLAKFGSKKIVLTGVYFDDKQMGVAIFDSKKNNIEYVLSDNIKGFYHGTGDVFASSLLAAVLKGKSLSDSAKIAVDFTVSSILRTDKADLRFGVNFEAGLGKLISDINNKQI